MNGSYLVHHGVKGQKWGVRRYQNPDGTLTDEGRRRYGFGRGAEDVITKNTKSRILGGTKLGAKVGAAVGGISGVASGAYLAAALVTPYYGIPAGIAYAGSLAVTSTLSSGLSGALYGGVGGAIVGAVETKRGRDYIKRYDKGIDEFDKRDRR